MKAERGLKESRWIRALRLTAALLWCGVVVWAVANRNRFTLEAILSYTPKRPLLAALAIIVLFAIKSCTVVLYSGLLYTASGVLFPLPAAILVNTLGSWAMVSVPYILTKRLGQGQMERLHARYPRLRSLDVLRRGNDLLFATLLRSVKLVNYDVGSMYAGAARLHYPSYVAGSLIGLLPEIVLYPLMGANIGNPHAPAFWLSLGANLLLSLAALTAAWRFRLLSARRGSEGRKQASETAPERSRQSDLR